MSSSTLADRFQLIQATQTKNNQVDRLMNMSFEEAGLLTIRFGESKMGQKFQDVVKEDQKYCQWFLRKFAESTKPEHMEFVHYLNMYVERKELEMDLPTGTQAQPKPKGMPKKQGGPGRGNPCGAPSTIDIDLEEESWDQLSAQSAQVENHNSQRLDVIENALSHIMNQLQVLTAGRQDPSAA